MATLEDKKKLQTKEKQAYAYYISMGWTPEQSIGIVSNLLHESNFNTSKVGTADDKGSQGIAQWHGSRLKALKDRYGDNWTDFRNQLEFVDWELKHTEKGAGDKLKKSSGIWEAGMIVADKYERPKVSFNSDDRRQRILGDTAMRLKGLKTTPSDLPQSQKVKAMPDFNSSFTSDVNFLNFSPQMTNFAPVPEKKEEVVKNLEVERVEKESKFLRALEQLPQEDFAQLQTPQPQVQQYQPQKNYVQEYEQISQFVDAPIAQQGGTPVSPQGLYDYPRQKVIVPTNSGEITMKGIDYNVLGIDELGNKKLMLPNGEYKFPGKTITEIPII